MRRSFRDIAVQQKSAYTAFRSRGQRELAGCAHDRIRPSSRLSPPPPSLVDSAQGSNALGFFLRRACALAARERREPPRMMRLPQSSPLGDHDRHGRLPPASPRRQAPRRSARRLPPEDPDGARLRRRDRVGARAAPACPRGSATRCFFKREDTQPVFSFKLRGAYNKMAHLSPQALARGVICASAGNHAQGVALSAHRLGCKALVVMPDDDALAQGRRGARPRRRGGAARRQLLRVLADV